MSRSQRTGGIKIWSRLRTRMAVSYVAVTLVIVLLLESLVVAVVWIVVTRSPMVGYWALQRAGHAAQIYALQAAVYADGPILDPDTTFEPDQAASLRLRSEDDPPQLSWFNLSVPYVESGAPAPTRPAVALLIGTDEQVHASSYPDRYPVSIEVAEAMPEEATLIREALSGRSNGAVRETSQGMHASVAHTVWSENEEPLGAVYIQAPAGGPPDTNLLADVASFVIPSGVAWLCLMLPIGMVFGMLTMRGLVQRIERLTDATARFTEGDYSQRVQSSRADEIGQLENQFNVMAEQLVTSFEQQRALAEQSARREERARIEQEMQSAYYIQKSLLPETVPSIPGWQIEPFYRPARQVGGDLYDFLSLPDGKIGFVIGDANGKGMPSALIMATTTAMLRAAAPGVASPGQVLQQVNDLLHVHIPPKTFATCFFAILDPENGRLRFANAGHNLPFLAHNGEISELWSTGMPLGLMPEQEYAEGEVTVVAEDCLLFYSDGLVEAHDAKREMFGSPRLKSLLQEHSNDEGLIEILLRELEGFTGAGWEQEDDVTLVTLRKVS
jgi:serine phosphatase RsbU (regulator of sigma subunit)